MQFVNKTEWTPASVVAKDWGWRHATRKDFVLRNVNIDIKPGEHVLLLGASGAGKYKRRSSRETQSSGRYPGRDLHLRDVLPVWTDRCAR